MRETVDVKDALLPYPNVAYKQLLARVVFLFGETFFIMLLCVIVLR